VYDENYSMMIDLIEKKAKLEVNENEPYNNNLLKDPSKNQKLTLKKQSYRRITKI
jgi:predicted N-formylglutamate amidohydrolase